ncbi:MAG: tyrosine--tRNA ligase [Desulfurococcaceae archaeon]
MDVEERMRLATRNAVEVVTRDELRRALEAGRPRAYLGFEPSGLVHVGWLVWMYKVRDLVSAGVDFVLLGATWHAYINDKLGGDMDLIRRAAKYALKVLEAIGATGFRYVDAEELVSDKEYWSTLIRAAKSSTLARVRRALTIMGRRYEDAELDFSKLIYPLMQVTDIFYLDLDIALGGMDQRKAHMLARDVAERLGRKKVVAIHTPIITGLQGPRASGGEVDEQLADSKMSKSKPETAIFVHEPPEAVERKVMSAYCPPREAAFNPVIEIAKYLLFQQEGFRLRIERPAKYGGDVEVESAEELESLYRAGSIHPLDLKASVARELNRLLEPVRAKILGDREASELVKELSEADSRR